MGNLLENLMLDYLEAHVTDHCNYKCQGCGHFSTLASKKNVDVSIFERDIKRMSELIPQIHHVRLMGGEPLLHPKVVDFLYVTRKYYPKSRISLVSNGLLIKKMKSNFWTSITDNNIQFELTVYPYEHSTGGKYTVIDQGVDLDYYRKKYGVDIKVQKTAAFFSLINLRGDSNPKKAMGACRTIFNCPNLYEGKVFICPMTANINYFNDKFKTSIPGYPISKTGWIDIHEEGITAEKLLKHIDTSCSTCKFCTENPTYYKWKLNKKPEISDWISPDGWLE